MLWILFIAGILFRPPLLPAADIVGVQPAALDQPRINCCLRLQPASPPLSPAGAQNQPPVKKDDPFSQVLQAAGPSFNITAFLDTGASGIMLSAQTADALGVQRELSAGTPTLFHDVGVGGGDTFNISQPLYLAIAPYAGNTPSDISQYTQQVGPIRAQVGPLHAGLLQALTGGLDVVGMPAMLGKIVILDPKPVDTFADTMHARLYDPSHPANEPPPPRVSLHVQLSFASFERFTSTIPPQANPPTFAPNPFVGPSPLSSADRTPPVTLTFNGQSAAVGFLLDTGAAASMISTQTAARLGVHYVPGTQNTDHPKLAGIPDKQQFTLDIGGVGGTHKAAGFYLDTLTLPTREGDPITYKPAPVLVSDVTVEDPQTHQKLTLPGVLGMNYFVASAALTTTSLLPDIGQLTQGPYQWITINLRQGLLGLELKK